MSEDRAALVVGYGWSDVTSSVSAYAAAPPVPARPPEARGLRYKDAATQLAVRAAAQALACADLGPGDGVVSARTGVIVSTNLGNLGTVCRTATCLRAGSSADLSAMDLPNASSNVIAATLAIRHGFRGLNLTVCSGATAGVDGLFLARVAIQAGRVDRVLLVGVEPRDEVGLRLSAIAGAEDGHEGVPALCEIGAAVLVEAGALARLRRCGAFARIGTYRSSDADAAADDVVALIRGAGARTWFTPDRRWRRAAALAHRVDALAGATPLDRCDVSASFGELYGTLGIVQAICALPCLARTRAGAVVTAGSAWGDGCASVVLGHEPGMS